MDPMPSPLLGSVTLPPCNPATLKISVVTPSLNQGQFLEAALCSVLDQNCPNLEYIVIDGGSTDGSVDIIRKYADRLAYWVSEPDKGHYDAVNKGFARATGDILCWINADDMLVPGGLFVVNEVFGKFPHIQWITGTPALWNPLGHLAEVIESTPVYSRSCLSRGEHNGLILHGVQQESCFWRSGLWKKVGSHVDTRWHLGGDFDLWTRMAQYADLITVGTVLAGSRIHSGQRSARQKDEYFRQIEAIAATRGERRWMKILLVGKLGRLRGWRVLCRLVFRDKGVVLRRDWSRQGEWIERSRFVV
jgi:glycosyltransferase involved in cell wall biosynthesis